MTLKRQSDGGMGVRTAVLNSLNIGTGHFLPNAPVHRVSDLGALLRYAMSGAYSRKRRIPVDVNALADQWVQAIAKMCTSHNKDGYDAGDV